MNRNPHSRQRINAVHIAVALIMCFVCTVYAQTGCSNKTTDKFGQGKTVYYDLRGFSSTQQQQIRAAIDKWNEANRSNNSRVNFAPSDASHLPTYIFQAGTTTAAGNTGRFATTTWETVSETDRTVATAQTTFYLNETFSSGTPVYDDNGEGSDTIYLKVALHEIGHPMGLNHPTQPKGASQCDQTDGATVMNGFCGTNDRTNNAPTSIQSCDTDNLNSNYPTPSPSPTPSPTPGGGDDGCPCGDCINYCCNPGSANSDETESTANLNECGGGEDECGWVEVPGQCYGGVAYGDCWDDYGTFDKYRDNCQSDPPHCDPDQNIWYCP